MKEKFKQAFMDVAVRFSKLSYAKRLQVGAIIVKDDRIISIGYNGMPSGWDNECEYVELLPVDSKLTIEEQLDQYPYVGNFWINGYSVERRYKLTTRPEVLHAESNAIAKLAKSVESGEDATLFVTHSPCIDCAKLIFQSGINHVYYRTPYRNNNGIDFLSKSGIHVEQI